jgi:hypothetical protein
MSYRTSSAASLWVTLRRTAIRGVVGALVFSVLQAVVLYVCWSRDPMLSWREPAWAAPDPRSPPFIQLMVVISAERDWVSFYECQEPGQRMAWSAKLYELPIESRLVAWRTWPRVQPSRDQSNPSWLVNRSQSEFAIGSFDRRWRQANPEVEQFSSSIVGVPFPFIERWVSRGWVGNATGVLNTGRGIEWEGLLLNFGLAVLIGATSVWWWPLIASIWRVPREGPACRRCGYDFSGLSAAACGPDGTRTCPECGDVTKRVPR